MYIHTKEADCTPELTKRAVHNRSSKLLGLNNCKEKHTHNVLICFPFLAYPSQGHFK